MYIIRPYVTQTNKQTSYKQFPIVRNYSRNIHTESNDAFMTEDIKLVSLNTAP